MKQSLLRQINEQNVIDKKDALEVAIDIKSALDNIKYDLPEDLDFDMLINFLQTELNITKKEAALISNILKTK